MKGINSYTYNSFQIVNASVEFYAMTKLQKEHDIQGRGEP